MEPHQPNTIPIQNPKQILAAILALRPAHQKPFVIGVAGGSCSGKTHICKQLASTLPPPTTTFSLDHYYLNKPTTQIRNFDEPDALDWPLMIAHIKALAAGSEVQCPVYDFATHSRIGFRPLPPAETLLVEGLFALHAQIRTFLHVGVYVDAPIKTAWDRRRTRDTQERGRTLEDIDRQFRTQVEPMFHQHVHWQKDVADIIIQNP